MAQAKPDFGGTWFVVFRAALLRVQTPPIQ
jgi:hypothetical protein